LPSANNTLETDNWDDSAAVEKRDKEPVVMKMWHRLVVAKENLKGCIAVHQAAYPATSTLLITQPHGPNLRPIERA
jgi:hypothetical protein